MKNIPLIEKKIKMETKIKKGFLFEFFLILLQTKFYKIKYTILFPFWKSQFWKWVGF